MKTVLILFLFSLSACASAPTATILPNLENRTLLVSKEVPGLYYQWKTCAKPGLFGTCREEHMVTEQYDLRDDATREKLRNMGFSATSERKIKP